MNKTYKMLFGTTLGNLKDKEDVYRHLEAVGYPYPRRMQVMRLQNGDWAVGYPILPLTDKRDLANFRIFQKIYSHWIKVEI